MVPVRDHPGQRQPREGVEPDIAFAIVSTDAPGFKVVPVWDGMGLRATGSHDLECEELAIPRARAFVVPREFMRQRRAASEASDAESLAQLQRTARHPLSLLGAWLGSAQALLDATVAFTSKRKKPAPTGQPPQEFAELAYVQAPLGRMDYWVESGRTMLYDAVNRVEASFPSRHAFERHMLRAIYHLRRMSEEVVAGAMQICGSHGYARMHPIERMVRDVTGFCVMLWRTDEVAHALGRGAFGPPLQINSLPYT